MFSKERLDELAKNGISVQGDVRLGMNGKGTLEVESPVQLRGGTYEAVDRIGAFTYLGGKQSIFRHISSIGRFCLISRSIDTGSVEHPLSQLSPHPMFQGRWESTWPQLKDFYRENSEMIRKSGQQVAEEAASRFKKIEIGNDVWIGEGVFIRRGVRIGDGAVIASRSVVLKDVEPYTIVGGVPAKFLKHRFEPRVIEEIQRLRWWDYGVSALNGVDFTDVEDALVRIDENIRTGVAEPYNPGWTKLSWA